MPDRVILAIQFTPASTAGAVRRAVGGFLRYVQYRDKHDGAGRVAADPKVSGLLKYVAYRDRSVPKGLLFGPDGPAGDPERRELAAMVGRAVASTRPQIAPGPDGALVDRRRAVYRLVISPESAEGLDLRTLTRAAMRQLGEDAGADLHWVAAEHRNTAHPHVHVVLSGFVDRPTGGFRGLVVTRRRLQRMKDALASDISRQRGLPARTPDTRERERLASRRRPLAAQILLRQQHLVRMRPPVRTGTAVGLVTAATALRRAAARYRAQLDEEQRAADRRRERER